MSRRTPLLLLVLAIAAGLSIKLLAGGPRVENPESSPTMAPSGSIVDERLGGLSKSLAPTPPIPQVVTPSPVPHKGAVNGVLRLALTRHLGKPQRQTERSPVPNTLPPPSAPISNQPSMPASPPATPPSGVPTPKTTVMTTDGGFKYALGGGIYRMPRWMGAGKQDNTWIPYIDVSWNDAIEFSTTDGLQIDLLQGKKWHGGLVGTMLWGRSTHDIRDLPSGLGTLKNSLQAGLYLEYAITPELSLGGRWRHDITNTGAAYADLYADLDLPKIGPVEHDIKVSTEFWSGAAMRRVFGVTPGEARNLGISAYSPGSGVSQVAMNYQVFLPTSENTGFALEAGLARLTGNADRSPLVRTFGSRVQREAMAAFIVHF